MCGIAGMIGRGGLKHLRNIFAASTDRGRDAWGYYARSPKGAFVDRGKGMWAGALPPPNSSVVLANFRAEPITEWASAKDPIPQPYSTGKWWAVHNGTIANDKELRAHYQVEGCGVDSEVIPAVMEAELEGSESLVDFRSVLRKLKGSYAMALAKRGRDWIFLATNYKPIWLWFHNGVWYFASQEKYLPCSFMHPAVMLPPYSVAKLSPQKEPEVLPLEVIQAPPKALAVCSGGMDSVVAATLVQRQLCYPTTLLHFRYGCRAEGREVQAVHDVAQALGTAVVYLETNAFKEVSSPLLSAEDKVVGGEAGAEFAHEWVPARNLVMLSIAAAYAESHSFTHLVLGNNLEEAGAYPDNEMEFINRFNALLPFALADGKRLQCIMPVGRLMKSEIIQLGLELSAPLHLTWSCYRSGAIHCGTCGPCLMRRASFEKLGVQDPLPYLK